MNYNITDVDTRLSENLQGPNGSRIKKTLLSRMKEQEVMLDIFSNSINHCIKQIDFYSDKIKHEKDDIKKQDYTSQKIVFEDNKLIWNMAGFINLVSMDIKTIQVGMYFAETEWHKRFYARQACTIMYESSNDIFELLGKDFKDLISKRMDITTYENELKNIRSQLNEFRQENSSYLQSVRNNTAAHKDQDVLKQLVIITNINWSKIINITLNFETIINSLGAFLQRLINLGLNNLEDSPIGQNKL